MSLKYGIFCIVLHPLLTLAASSYRTKHRESCSIDQALNQLCGMNLLTSLLKAEIRAVERADVLEPEK